MMIAGGSGTPILFDCYNPAAISLANNPSGYNLSNGDLTNKTFVAIITGQSLAGNHIQGTYQPSNDVRIVNVCGDMKTYAYKEPMLGTTFTQNGYAGWYSGYGSIWGKLGDLLIFGGKYDRVIFVNVSVAGKPLKDFISSGELGHRLPVAFQNLNLNGIKPERVDAVIQLLGESDGINGTTQATYVAGVKSMISVSRNMGFVGKWIIPQETYAYNATSATIRAAQLELVNPSEGVISGGDFDVYGGTTYRYYEQDGTSLIHPNAAGRDALAGLLRDAIYNNF